MISPSPRSFLHVTRLLRLSLIHFRNFPHVLATRTLTTSLTVCRVVDNGQDSQIPVSAAPQSSGRNPIPTPLSTGTHGSFSTITFQTSKIEREIGCERAQKDDAELCSSRWRAGTGAICSPAPWLPHATACARVCAAAHSPCKLRGRSNLAMPVCWTGAVP